MTQKAYLTWILALLVLVLAGVGCATAEEETVSEDQPTQVAPPEEEKPLPGDMVLIPAGEFTMGSDENAGSPPFAQPAHTVDLPAYYIDVYEVTNGQFARFQLESDYQAEGDWRDFYTIGKEDAPVANVTLQDAKAYCEWAGKRLPTEAEWEKAARGPDNLPYPWGEQFDATITNTNENGIRNVVEVGTMGDVSGYGLYDTMGNVQEWTSDVLRPYQGAPAEVRNHPAVNGDYYVVRGASYAMKGRSMYLWTRSGYLPKSQFGLGFRCARDADEDASQNN